jgi:uncharacterized protein VirK/YbjX
LVKLKSRKIFGSVGSRGVTQQKRAQGTGLTVVTHRFVHASDPAEIYPSENRLGRVDVLKRLLHAASFAHPGTKKLLRRRTAAHFARCAFHLRAFRAWFGDPANPALQETLAQRPSLIMCVIHPYLNADWRFEQKLEKISGHYRLLSERLGILRFVPPAFIALADVGGDIQIRLHKYPYTEHEGELTISLYRGDLRLYSLTFTLGQIGAQLVAYAGALQGLGSSEALEMYRSLTHRMQGLRPRDLLVTAFRLLCCSLGVARILAISDRKRICSNSYHNSVTQIFSSFDNAWIECGGVAVDDAFFELNPHLVRRAAEDIPSRKRAQYRRRYAMLDTVAQQIGDSVTHATPLQTTGMSSGVGRRAAEAQP